MSVPDPIVYWIFDNTSGNTVTDTRFGCVITLDRVSWAPGRGGRRAIRFNRNDGAKLATIALSGDPLSIPPHSTITFWVMREEDCDGAALFSARVVPYGLKLEQWENTHQVGFTKYSVDDDIGYDKSLGCTVPLKEWTHVALVVTKNSVKVYVNGKGQELELTEQLSVFFLEWLGSTQGYVEIASAIFDEMRIFDVVLTDEQVGELANESPWMLSANMLKNGSFEEGDLPAGKGYITVGVDGPSPITGWTVARGTVDYYGTGWKAVNGSRSIDLNGDNPGAIQQTFATVPGTVYTVEFSMAGNPDGGPNPKVMRVEVTPSTPPQSQEFSFDTTGYSHDNLGWKQMSWQFTAQATTTSIEFSGVNEGSYGPVLDNVVVVQPKP
jgi:choice-of-anchor C domain-containing protein